MKKACLILLAGIYAPQLSSFASHSDLIPLLTFAIVAGIVTGRLLTVSIAAFGYMLFVLAAGSAIDARISPDNVGDSIMADVYVADFPQRRGSTMSFVGRVDGNPWVPKRIRVSWFEPAEEIRFGDTWRLELRLRRPRGGSNPGVFDYENWLFRNGFAATAYVVDSSRNVRLDLDEPDMVGNLRRKAVQRILSSGAEPDRAAVLAAITVGARHLVTREQWDRYALTGTSHLMAISGLHVGMIAVVGYCLACVAMGFARARVNQHRYASIIALACATAYALLSGMGVPAQRAAAMIGLAALAMFAGKPLRPFRTVAASCMAVAVLSPLSTMAPGFKLSFAAVVILIWHAKQFVAVNRGPARAVRTIRVLAAVQFSLLLGLLTLTVLAFDRVALVAPVVNLLAVPVFSFTTVPLAFGGLLLGADFGNYLLQLAAWTLGFVEWLIDLSLEIPGSGVQVPELAGWARALLIAPLAWVISPPGWPGRSIAWLGLLAIVSYAPPRPAVGCARIDVLDVGQGLATVVATHSSTLLFDAGPAFRGGGSAAETVVLPFLASRGIAGFDNVVVSHADLDHSGGIDTILNAVAVGRLLVGEPLGRIASERRCTAGHHWTADHVRFEFLYPSGGAPVEGNDASCVLRVSAGSHHVLLTGDIERPAEAVMLQSGPLGEVDAVVVPHHGSKTSSSQPFVEALSPDLAIVSAAWGNRWGLPDEAVVDRWRRAGASVLNTATDGAVGLLVCGQGGILVVSRHRDLQRRIWHE